MEFIVFCNVFTNLNSTLDFVSIKDRIKHDAFAPLPLPLKRKFRLAITQLFTLRSFLYEC